MTTQSHLLKDETLKYSVSDLPSIDVLRGLLENNPSVTITFAKTDGSERVMNCTRYNAVLEAAGAFVSQSQKPVEDDPNNPFAEIERLERQERLRANNLVVWDLDKNAWRSIRYVSIYSFQVNN